MYLTRKPIAVYYTVYVRYVHFILVSLGFYYSYLHGCEIPIVHGNLSCDTIFIQHNGLIKIGSGVS